MFGTWAGGWHEPLTVHGPSGRTPEFGDGRPSELDIKYAKGCDLYITELQTEWLEISSGVQRVPPFLGHYTVDTHHTPGYAAGYLASKIKPRMFMTTHMPFDPYINEETVAEVRHHWKGP